MSAPLSNYPASVREYVSADEMRANAARLREQFFPKQVLRVTRPTVTKAIASAVAPPIIRPAVVDKPLVPYRPQPSRRTVDRDRVMGLARMGVSSSAIAKELGCASRTVRSIIARAREQGELVRLPDRDILFVATRTETVGPREHMRNIIRETAGRAGVTVAEFTGSRRTASMTEIRRAAMARVYRECPELSLPEIGRGFGRDHTTILHHLREAGVYIPVKQKED